MIAGSLRTPVAAVGLADVALGWEGTCGNKTCSFELFLRTPDGRYRRVGTLGGLPFAYRIVPLRVGGAKLVGDRGARGMPVVRAVRLRDLRRGSAPLRRRVLLDEEHVAHVG